MSWCYKCVQKVFPFFGLILMNNDVTACDGHMVHTCIIKISYQLLACNIPNVNEL